MLKTLPLTGQETEEMLKNIASNMTEYVNTVPFFTYLVYMFLCGTER